LKIEVERTDVFKQILETEQIAKTQREDAVKRQAGLEQYLAEKEAENHRESYAVASAEIVAEEAKYSAEVDTEIKKLKSKQLRDVLNIHISFDKKLELWVDTLFEIVVGNT